MTTATKNVKSTADINIKSNLSVIIPSYKSKYLNQVIESAKEFAPFEIIVVDTSPRKPIIDNVLLYYQKERLNAAAARNKGAELATGDLLLFIDSDIILNKKNKEFINQLLYKKETDVICGLYEKTVGENLISRFQRGILEMRLGYAKSKNPQISSSSHFLIRKNDFNKSGGFNETMEFYEDVEFFQRCRKVGLNIELYNNFQAIHLK